MILRDLRLALLQRLEDFQAAGIQCVSRPARATRPHGNKRDSVADEIPNAVADSQLTSLVNPISNRSNPSSDKPAYEVIDVAKPRTAEANDTTERPSVDNLVLSGKPLSREERVRELAVLKKTVVGCQRCPELATTRTQTVFGVGHPQPRLCFFGEAPGADEDRLGEPFVGRAGDLLNKIIEACQMRREDVYIMNVLKCRPPGNRNPAPDEIDCCRGYFERQFEIIRPEFICCLGAFAAKTLLETNLSIGNLRGELHDYRGIPVLATYHPAYLLRNPPAKKLVWEDMQILLRAMSIQLPSRKAK